MEIDNELHAKNISHLHLEQMNRQEWCLILDFSGGQQQILSIGYDVARDEVRIIDAEG
jgi:hypothetical protein